MRSRQQTIAIILSKFKKNHSASKKHERKQIIGSKGDPAWDAGHAIAKKHGAEIHMSTVGYSGDWKLYHLEVPKGQRKQGIGSKAMDDIIAAADKAGKRVLLDAASKDDSMGTTSRTRLHTFYKRFGFVRNHGRSKDYSISAGMYRNPVPKKVNSIIP